ncbi:MAG: hypothetical protein RMJ19_12145 [Gemmatales bacterium]|nr:hypothetical protein [Gemmatales bacterium]MDW8176417.1 hypothetical protein [Gemmatales bacterium]
MSTLDQAKPRTAPRFLSDWLTRLAERLADLPNPIVVKELRQAVRGWTALAMLLFYLIVQLLVVGLMLMDTPKNLLDESALGNQVFLAIQILLIVTTVGLLPLYAGTRLFLERTDVNLDLMFATPLRPVWLVLGKLLAALVLGLLFFSASAPVMTMAYFLRGLDLVKSTALLGLDILMMLTAVQVALLVAAMPVPRPVAAVLGLGLIFGLFGTVVYLISLSEEVMVMSFFHRPDDYFLLVVLALSAFFVTLFAFTATHALLSPPPSNRLFSFKLMLALTPPAFWILLGLLSWKLTDLWNRHNWHEVVHFWLIGLTKFQLVAGWLAWMIAISERLEWGPRLLAQVPRSRWLRVIVFPFYSGAANGLVFALLLTVIRWLTIVVGLLMESWIYRPTSYPSFLQNYFAHNVETAWVGDGYVLVYALTAFNLRRYWETRRGKLFPGWVVLLVLSTVTSFVGVLLAIIGSLLDFPDRLVSHAFVLVPLPLVDSLIGEHLEEELLRAWPYPLAKWLVILCSLLMIIPTLVWWLGQVRYFRPLPRQGAEHREKTPVPQVTENPGPETTWQLTAGAG